MPKKRYTWVNFDEYMNRGIGYPDNSYLLKEKKDRTLFERIDGWLNIFISMMYPYLTYLDSVALSQTSKLLYHTEVHIKSDDFYDKIYDMSGSLSHIEKKKYGRFARVYKDNRLYRITGTDRIIVLGTTVYLTYCKNTGRKIYLHQSDKQFNDACYDNHTKEKYYYGKWSMKADVYLLLQRFSRVTELVDYDSDDEWYRNHHIFQRRQYHLHPMYKEYLIFSYQIYKEYYEDLTDKAWKKIYGFKAVYFSDGIDTSYYDAFSILDNPYK